MKKNKKYLLIAHYHQEGLIRKDLVNLIKLFNKHFEKIIFISTKLKSIEKKKIIKYSKIITRPNYGYDFYSYKVGINHLLTKDIKKTENKTIYFMASSVLYLRPQKLLNELMKIKIVEDNIYGLTKSWEIQEHLQSDLFFFPANLLDKNLFLNWWKNIKKFKTRQIIINKYELGLSIVCNKLKIKINALFQKNIKDYPFSLKNKLKNKFKNIFYRQNKIYKKNPTHYYWEEKYKQFGTIKIELLKINPHKINLNRLNKYFNKKIIAKLKKDCYEN